MKPYIIEHTGYPVAGRPIEEKEWKVLSTHKNAKGVVRKIHECKKHLSLGVWDDHYRIKFNDNLIRWDEVCFRAREW